MTAGTIIRSSVLTLRSRMELIAGSAGRHAHRVQSRAVGIFQQTRLGLAEGLALMDRYQALARLSPWSLARRGLRRSDIAAAAQAEDGAPAPAHLSGESSAPKR